MKTSICHEDCLTMCTGCGKTFCDIKEENNIPHDDELIDIINDNGDDIYCGDDCYPFG